MRKIYNWLRTLNNKRKRIRWEAKLSRLKGKYRKAGKLNPQDYRSVCLLMLSHGIGDAIVVSGLIMALRKNNIKVLVMTNEKTSVIFKNLIENDGVLVSTGTENTNALDKLQEQAIDLIIDFSIYDDMDKLYRMKLISFLKPKHTIGFNGTETTLFDTNILTSNKEHVTVRMKKILNMLSMERDPYKYVLSFDEELTRTSACKIQSLRCMYKNIIIFNPLSGDDNRSLSAVQIESICEYLNTIKDSITIIFNMGRNFHIHPYANVIENPYKDIENSFNLVKESDIVITVDTSIVHLASAYDLKQYCIYNNRITDVNIANIVWGPNSDNAKQLTTTEFRGTPDGDDMTKFDVHLLFRELEHLRTGMSA